MNQSILVTRVLIVLFCALGGYMVSYVFPDMVASGILASLVGALLGALLVLVDMLLKGFSLRALLGLTFGLLMGVLASHLITVSPLFEGGDPQVLYISRLCVFIGVAYLSTVIALRGRDEFNLVIPYVKFERQNVDVPLVVLDSSALVDGRVVKLAEGRLLSHAVAVPKFVIDELHELAISSIDDEKNRRDAYSRRVKVCSRKPSMMASPL